MLKEIIILVLVGYVISRVLRFVIPIFRISSAAGDHMRKMQEQMQAQMNEMNRKAQEPTPKKPLKKEGDYIDYEEVR